MPSKPSAPVKRPLESEIKNMDGAPLISQPVAGTEIKVEKAETNVADAVNAGAGFRDGDFLLTGVGRGAEEDNAMAVKKVEPNVEHNMKNVDKEERLKRIRNQASMGTKNEGAGSFIFDLGSVADLALRDSANGFQLTCEDENKKFSKKVKWSYEMETRAYTYEEIKKMDSFLPESAGSATPSPQKMGTVVGSPGAALPAGNFDFRQFQLEALKKVGVSKGEITLVTAEPENSRLEWACKGVFAIHGWGSRWAGCKPDWAEEPLKNTSFYFTHQKIAEQVYALNYGEGKKEVNEKVRVVHETFLRTLDDQTCNAVTKAKSVNHLPSGVALHPYLVMVNSKAIVISNVQAYNRMIEKSGIMERMLDVPIPYMYKTNVHVKVVMEQYKDSMGGIELTIDGFINFLRQYADGNFIGIQSEEVGLGGFGRD